MSFTHTGPLLLSSSRRRPRRTYFDSEHMQCYTANMSGDDLTVSGNLGRLLLCMGSKRLFA
jgi:hypothetical protein